MTRPTHDYAVGRALHADGRPIEDCANAVQRLGWGDAEDEARDELARDHEDEERQR